MVDVVLVDENDLEIGKKEKMQAHYDGDLHRAFSILLFNSKKEILIHQRNKNKYHCGGEWTNACCSHPFPGENILDAANRRLFEELGYENLDLEKKFNLLYKTKFDNGLTEHEFDHIFFTYSNLDPPLVNTEEVEDFKWISMGDLQVDILESPNKYTSWFKLILKKIEEDKILI